MAPGDRPRLFLSSTVMDLAPFREVAVHVCQRLGADVVAMEEFGPDPRAAADVCREKVESADVFLGLYAHRYGYVPDGFDGRSITELEYEWAAGRRPAPRLLLFVIDDELLWPPKWIDHGESWDRLQKFIKRLRTSHVTGTLTTPEQLREELFVHLPRFLEQAPAAVAPRLPPLPQPPEAFVAHQYTLLQTERVVGREAELTQLDAWADDPQAARLLSLVAIGGMGKSALAWKWFHERASQAMKPLAGRFWWSFYEADAGFDRFIVMALAYCTGQAADAVAALSPVDREYQVLAVLDSAPFLLVLDGLERVLIAYANLDFAHLADEDLDRSTGHVIDWSGRSGGDAITKHRLRQTIDPRAGEFLRKLTRVRTSRTLVSTRLFPSALQTVTGQPMPGSEAWFLTGLQPDDALALWRAMGVSGDDAELTRLFESIGYYPLLIRALAGEVAGYRPAPGDLGSWRQAHSDFDPYTLPLIQAKSHVLAYALSDLSADAREVLQTAATFRAPVDYQTVAALFVERRDWSPQRLDEVLSVLEDRGLLGWDRTANRYDLHPVVRGVVWSGLDDVRRRALYGQLEQHFSSGPAKAGMVRSVEEALPVIELMRSLIGLGRYPEAASIYFERLHSSDEFDWGKSGMHHVHIALLEGFFPAWIGHLPMDQAQDIKSIISQLGHAYQRVGRLTDAHRCAMWRIEARTSDNIIPSLYMYASQRELQLGHLRMAWHWAEKSVGPGRGSHCFEEDHLALCEATRGRYKAALRRLALTPSEEYYTSDRSEARVRFWMGQFDRAAELGRRVLAWSTPYFVENLEVTVETAEADLHLGHVDESIDAVMDVLRTARAKGLVEVELHSLRCLADAHRLRGDDASAVAFLDDLDEIAARGPYRLIHADAANIRALLPGRDPAQRRAAAEEAYRLAWCDGPPYAYHWALERARQTLDSLGAPTPRGDS